MSFSLICVCFKSLNVNILLTLLSVHLSHYDFNNYNCTWKGRKDGKIAVEKGKRYNSLGTDQIPV